MDYIIDKIIYVYAVEIVGIIILSVIKYWEVV